MSDDLVKQAREAADSCKLSTKHMWLVSTMADRIEKLQAALREIIDRAEHRMGHAVSDDVCAIARKALEGKDE